MVAPACQPKRYGRKSRAMIPKRLLRFFKEKQHAEEFVSGKIRIGKISCYRDIEDSRKDDSEGTSSFIWDTPAPELIIDKRTMKTIGITKSQTEKIKWNGTLINPLYLLCTTRIRVNKIIVADKFGRYFVDINDPSRLLGLLKKHWATYPWSLNGKVELKRVRYTRGNLVRPNKYLMAPQDISYTQKSLEHKDECEYRFVFWCKVNQNIILDDYLYMDIAVDNNVIKDKIQVISGNIKSHPITTAST